MADDIGNEGVPPLAAVLLIGNLFLLVGLLLVDSMAVRVGLLVAAMAMLAGGVLILSRHAARLKAVHAAEAATRDGDDAGDAREHLEVREDETGPADMP